MRFDKLLSLAALLLLAPVGLASEPPAALFADPPAAYVERAEAKPVTSDAVAIVDVGRYSGSGVSVACDGTHSLVLTNRHIVGIATAPTTVILGGKKYPAVESFTYEDVYDDLVILVVKGELPTPTLAESDPAEGEAVTLYGYDWRGQGALVKKEGKVLTAEPKYFRSTLEPVSGDSGGGVFDARGHLVSVNHGFSGTYEKRGPQLGVRLVTIRAFARAKLADRFPRLHAKLHGKAAPAPMKLPDPPAAKKPEAPKPKEVKPAPKAVPAAPVVTWRVERYRVGFRTYSRLVPVVQGEQCPNGRCPLKP